MIRPRALAAVAVVAALLGGATALLLGKSAGWIDGGNETVVVQERAPATPASSPVSGNASRPLTGNGFDPAELYRARAAGVVTIVALFGEHAQTGAASQGSGFVVTDEGYVLTNSHVITTAGEGDAGEEPEAATSVFVEYRDGERVGARIVGWDLYDDVGLLKVDPRQHPVSPVPLGDSGEVVVGEPVAAIGSPFGQMSSLAVGVVSATARSIESLTSEYDLVDAIQTDAPINRGNSGGPLFDADGRVVGINAQIRTESGNAEGVGFAVPINAARRSMDQLIATGEVRYAWLGVSTQTVTPRLAERFGYDAKRGAAVQAVIDGSPADDADLRGGGEEEEFAGLVFRPGGDLIIAIDGTTVRCSEDLIRAVAERLAPGEEATLTVVRGSKRLAIDVILEERPPTPTGSGR